MGGSGPPVPAGGPIASNPGPTSRFLRLSHKQWENTVRDLFRMPMRPGLSSKFIPESSRTTFDNNGSILSVSRDLWTDYHDAAESLARTIARDARQLTAILPPGLPADAAGKARGFVTGFGLRAFRRPLTPEETTQLLGHFNQGPALIGSTDAFADGVELVIALVLQSPYFVYRTELTGGTGKIALTDYEIGSRLSYGLTGSMPDDMLFAAAAAGQLRTRAQLLAHADRLMRTAGFQEAMRDMNAQAMGMLDYDEVKRDAKLHPQFATVTGGDLREETLTFIKDIVDSGKGVKELFTSAHTFVNSKLAPFYGKTVPAPRAGQPDPFVRVDLDPMQRSGLLTHIGFLSATATDTDPRSIIRGVHLALDHLCLELPTPDSIPMLPPRAPTQTNRQLLEEATHQGMCSSCHKFLINPLGFALENFDGVGRFRTKEASGQPIDASSSYAFANETGATVIESFNGPVELGKILARGPQAHECYAKHLFEYIYGKELANENSMPPPERPLVSEVGKRSRLNAPIRQMILDLVATDAFLTRLP